MRNDVIAVRRHQKTALGWRVSKVDKMLAGPTTVTRDLAFYSGFLIYVKAEIAGTPTWKCIDFQDNAVFERKMEDFREKWDDILAVEITRTKVDLVAGDMSRIAAIYGEHAELKDDDRPQAGDGGAVEEAKAPPGEIVGFRVWRMYVPSALVDGKLVEGEPQLFSFYPGRHRLWVGEWPDIETVARCPEFRNHQAPEAMHNCGLHAWHSAEMAHSKLNGTVTSAEWSRFSPVWGAVLGSGTVFVYDDGWRGQTSRIIAFCSEVRPEFEPALRRMAQRLDVPVMAASELEGFAKKKGVVIRKEDLPEGPSV
jgi:hypothetical protein